MADLQDRPRVVIDTCVLLRAMFDSVYPEHRTAHTAISFNALSMARREHALCFSTATLEEANYILGTSWCGSRDETMRPEARQQFVSRYIEPYILMVESQPVARQCRDIKDQMFVEAALAVGAAYVISTDRDLLMLEREGACRFVRPEAFNCEQSERLRQQQAAARHRACALTV